MARSKPTAREYARRTLEREGKGVEAHGLVGNVTGSLAGTLAGGAAGLLPAAAAGKIMTVRAAKRVKDAEDVIATAKPKIDTAREEVKRLRKKGK